MNRQTAIGVGGLLLLLALAWFFRYETVPSGRGTSLVVNRWTGTIYVVRGANKRLVETTEPASPKPSSFDSSIATLAPPLGYVLDSDGDLVKITPVDYDPYTGEKTPEDSESFLSRKWDSVKQSAADWMDVVDWWWRWIMDKAEEG